MLILGRRGERRSSNKQSVCLSWGFGARQVGKGGVQLLALAEIRGEKEGKRGSMAKV